MANCGFERGAENEKEKKIFKTELLQLASSVLFRLNSIQQSPDGGRHVGIGRTDRTRGSRRRVWRVDLGSLMSRVEGGRPRHTRRVPARGRTAED